MNIYPAIDLKSGKVVRLLQGRADQETIYFDDPGKPAQLFKTAGSEWVHVVDLDGAFSGEPQNWAAISRIVSTGLRVEMGGGIRTPDAAEKAFDLGVERVVIGSKAADDLKFLETLVNKHGNRIAAGIDAKDGKVAVEGWVDTKDLRALDLALQVTALGVKTIIYTDISRDGMLTGPNFEAQEEMLQTVDADIIASGGVARREDIQRFVRLCEQYPNLEGVIVGKALYDERVELVDLLEIVG